MVSAAIGDHLLPAMLKARAGSACACVISYPSGSDPAALGRQHRGLDAVARPQLAEDVLEVGLHGVLAEVDLRGDLAVGVPAPDQAQDGDLRAVQEGGALDLEPAVAHPVQDAAGHLGRQHRLAAVHRPDAVAQAEPLDVLDDVPPGARLDALLAELVVRVAAQADDRDLGPGPPGLAAPLGAAPARP